MNLKKIFKHHPSKNDVSIRCKDIDNYHNFIKDYDNTLCDNLYNELVTNCDRFVNLFTENDIKADAFFNTFNDKNKIKKFIKKKTNVILYSRNYNITLSYDGKNVIASTKKTDKKIFDLYNGIESFILDANILYNDITFYKYKYEYCVEYIKCVKTEQDKYIDKIDIGENEDASIMMFVPSDCDINNLEPITKKDYYKILHEFNEKLKSYIDKMLQYDNFYTNGYDVFAINDYNYKLILQHEKNSNGLFIRMYNGVLPHNTVRMDKKDAKTLLNDIYEEYMRYNN